MRGRIGQCVPSTVLKGSSDNCLVKIAWSLHVMVKANNTIWQNSCASNQQFLLAALDRLAKIA